MEKATITTKTTPEVVEKKESVKLYGGQFGRVYLNIFKNFNKRNTPYHRICFSAPVGAGRFCNLYLSAGDLANLQAALDSAKKWLRDK